MRTMRALALHTCLAGALLLAAGLAMACQLSSLNPAATRVPTGGLPTAAGAVPTAASGIVSTAASGASRLRLDAGLKDLRSYRLSYSKSVQGNLDGKPYEVQEQITRTVVAQPAAEDSAVDFLGPDGKRFYLHYLRTGNDQYFQRSADAACRGLQSADQPGAIPEAVALLPPVFSPQQVGADTVNGIKATHYRFSGASVRVNSGTAAGELWIADSGGYLLKYSLEVQPPASLTNKGLEAHQVYQYALTDVNQVAKIDLPANCIPILDSSIPAMPDATDVERRSAFLSFTTPLKPEAVAAFYTQSLTSQGWAAEAPLEDQPPDPNHVSFSKDTLSLLILMDPNGGGLDVYVQLFDPAYLKPMPTSGPALPELPSGAAMPSPEPSPNFDVSQSGLPPEVPLYPGATQIQAYNGMGVIFQTTDSVDQVVTFYTAQVKNPPWKLAASSKMKDSAALQWQGNNGMLTMTMQAANGSTQVIIAVIKR